MKLRSLVVVVMTLVSVVAGTATASATGRRSYTGSIDGADYRVEVPDQWNGTLVVYSHPYYVPGIPPGMGLTNRPETEDWLLAHGYALAASDFKGRNGFLVEQGVVDQRNVLDWFTRHVGRPRDVVATGSSMGAAISLKLAERLPRQITGVVPMCGPLDMGDTWNTILDATFAIATLLAPGEDIEQVHVRDPARSVRLLQEAVTRASQTPAGRARLALAGSFANAPGWDRAMQPKPADLAGQLAQQAEIIMGFHVSTFGPSGRVDLEQRAGGNPLWNVGVDYSRQLAKSRERDLVERAYQAAGTTPDADLARLAAAPRISPDPAAVAWLYRNGIPTGAQRAPVITLHNVADAADPANESWLANIMRRNGNADNLRQLFAGRATHCAFTAAEEIVTMQVLFTRIRTGHWPSTNPATLNATAASLPAKYQVVYDYPNNPNAPAAPALTAFDPGALPRPSR
ncbi:DUF6351 family protein [Actinocrispum wychmicini]|uniref:X-Pro dipeptidyl-peptidase-like protein n=1 Tax=Actinocrispum wychmicini TaxID=1213861 RepID=A0A4R2JZ21_9PSEU|nr:DUF6351 family protein [Actinocrispum wychmicini]TCO62666.1 X-Pro dipeptidyl-peptidase-like protein [Actinocrispum wychmicini]